MELLAEPATGLVDEPPSWRVEGVPAGASVELGLTGSDGAGRTWRSSGTYAVDGTGRLDIPDLDLPWTGMHPADAAQPPVTFTAPEGAWTVRGEARSSNMTATAELSRHWGVDLVERRRDGDGWRLAVFAPNNADGSRPAVLVIPGSTGVAAVAPTARLLAAHGYPSAVLAYMNEPGLPGSMDRIPIEVLGRAMAGFTEADPDRIAVWAASFGTSLALAALADERAPRVRSVVAIAPTDVVWQATSTGGPPARRSALTRDGADVPWVPLRGEVLLPQILRHRVLALFPGRQRSTALRLYDAYARGRRDRAAVERATIPVDRIAAPLLLVAGGADAVWPAEEMLGRIVDRRQQAGVGAEDEVLLLDDAGHFCRPPATPTTVDRNADLVSGGTARGNAAAQRRAWDAALAFLQRTLAS